MGNAANEQQQQDFGVRRFAVLHHVSGAGGLGSGGLEDEGDRPHFDFLFDTTDSSSLVTFRLPDWPLAPGTHPTTRLRDHRRIYLTYEGSISGDRGHVSRVAEGSVRVIQTGSGWRLDRADGWSFLLFEPNDPARAHAGDEWRVQAF